MEKRCVKEKQRRNSQEIRRRGSREKQTRNSQEEASSRINGLPDLLLSHILSYLSTKDSVRSSVLSKRWRSLWLKVPVLDLDSDQFNDDVYDFVEYVDRFLKSDERLDLNRVKLVYYYEDEDDCPTNHDSIFESWMDALVRRRVRNLDFQVSSDDDELVCMPRSLYSCSTLVNLSLCHVALSELEPEAVVSLPCLKIMNLNRVRSYVDSNLEMLITSCPVLEKLSIIKDPFELFERICVRSLSLKSFTLEIDEYCAEQNFIVYHAVEIDAPRLEHMSLRDHFSRSIIIHSIAPSPVVNIDVDFGAKYVYSLDEDDDDDDEDDDDDVDDESKRTMIRNFVRRISTASRMTISSATLEVIHDFSKLELLPQFSNLSWLCASSLKSFGVLLPTFLDCCPNLHTLVLEFAFVREANLTKLSYVPPCFVSSLKFVQLRTPARDMTLSQMQLARYFLTNCAALEKLALSESFRGTIKEIKKIQRKSRQCNIVIKSATA